MDRQVRWCGVVTQVGEEVPAFAQAGMLVLFGENAPPELAAISLVHRTEVWNGPCAVGDILRLDGQPFRITAVGELANDHLRELGHVVIRFNGQHQPELQGDVCVEARPIPSLAPGAVLTIEAAPGAEATRAAGGQGERP
ncbi:MAG: PTS glucitol/sorbitol transporter subunit IIA [Limnochordales bacterium]|nr:PTS glucitol/sorbitol transporter subunit IIA [Limnochordales bacterium]